MAELLSGEISRIIYENEDGSFAIIRIRTDATHDYPARGPLAGLMTGQEVELTGQWEQHAEFGRQFKAERYRIILPTTPEGLMRFLGSGSIPGIGPKTAKLIIDHFGDDTLAKLDKGAEALKEVPGIGPVRAKSIAASWQDSTGRRDSMIFLQGLGITPAYCSRLFKYYGDAAPQIVRTNPYQLAEEVDGIGFLKADEIAQSVGIPHDSILRLTAAAVHSMNTMIVSGHVCVPLDTLVEATADLTGQTADFARVGVEAAVERRLLRIMDGNIYTAQLARAESELPRLIGALASRKEFAGQKLRRCAAQEGISFSDEQLLAVERASASPLCIITGGPGVGKTTVISEIVRRARKAGLKIALAAPTGRAAKRMSEATGVSAKTIHRLLQFDPATGHFTHSAEAPLPCELLIVDEVSMLDLPLATSLFRAVPPGCSVILVGDRDQLPSVGPGTVLQSFIESNLFLVTPLTRIFRQAEGSRIIVNAHRVNAGLMPEEAKLRPGELSDFYWIEQDDPEKTLSVIERLLLERIPARFGFDPVDDVQILTPMNRGSCGTAAINLRVEPLLNPGDKEGFKYGDRIFKAGDKVMQISNNYEKNVFNGDLGRIGRVLPQKKKFTVIFEGPHLVEYGLDEADQLVHAYAVTVHKAQGSEFPVVILPFLSQHYMMLQRKLLYTAMTRARKLLILIGSRNAVRMAVSNTREAPRYSLLGERLRAVAPQGVSGSGQACSSADS